MFFCALLSSSAFAPIGETLEQCDARYGKRIREYLNEEGNGTVYHRKNELNILVHIHTGDCDLIRYQPGGPLVRIDLEVAEYLCDINGRNKTLGCHSTRCNAQSNGHSGENRGKKLLQQETNKQKTNRFPSR